ncbi:hypothetical protein RBA41_11225 [Massilia sp. CCM 9210]|uniref:hypothetical protein n=1 Tax=Massilia scottii TaxID=3057166 RepID=UPI002796B870|nr:hypothetical protein [Massilia sp. CCM 9210]MDQ1813878.1 hypothetical protein [Massilia sp. CCM 9210]
MNQPETVDSLSALANTDLQGEFIATLHPSSATFVNPFVRQVGPADIIDRNTVCGTGEAQHGA